MKEQKVEKKPSAFGEFALWILVGCFATAMVLVAMTGAKYLLGWNEGEWITGSVVVGICSVTWGSWAALLWTRSRVLKTLMVAVTVVPGVIMVAGGLWAFFALPENRWIWRWGWLIVAGHGVGAMAMSVVLGGRRVVRAAGSLQRRSRQLVIGWTLFPVVVVAASILVVAVTLTLLPDLFSCDPGPLAAVAHWVIPSQAVVLLTTGLPAVTAVICDRLTQAGQT